MSDKEKVAANDDVISVAVERALKAVDERREQERKAREAEETRRQEMRDEILDELVADEEETLKAWRERKGVPASPKVTDLGSGEGLESDEVKSFLYYLHSGDHGAYRAAMQEGTDSEGGYLVPTALNDEIVAKLDEMSFARAMGAQIFRANSDTFRVPIEGNELSFSIVAEEGAANQSEPDLDALDITAYKYSNLIKVSEEMMADDNTNLMQYLTRRVAEKKALIENNHVATGTGSGQPEGVFVGGTAGLTSDSADTITAAEVPELFFKLESQYANLPSLAWLTNQANYSHLMQKTGNDFQFLASGVAPNQGSAARSRFSLMQVPLFTNGSVSTIATTNKTLLIGAWEYYGIFDRQGQLSMRRLDELYAETHQVGIRSSFRFGGAVLQAEAFQYLTQA